MRPRDRVESNVGIFAQDAARKIAQGGRPTGLAREANQNTAHEIFLTLTVRDGSLAGTSEDNVGRAWTVMTTGNDSVFVWLRRPAFSDNTG